MSAFDTSGGVVFEEGGSLDPLLKFLLYTVIALAAGKMLWKWLTEDVSRWIRVDLWRLAAANPWWTALTVIGGLTLLLLLVGPVRSGHLPVRGRRRDL